MKFVRAFIPIFLVFSFLASGCGSPKMTTYISLVPDTTQAVAPETLLQARQVLQRRLNSTLNGTSKVQVDNDSLRVGLSNEEDVPVALAMATQPGQLSFFHSEQPVETGQLMPADATVIFTGADIAKASVSLDSAASNWSIMITLTPAGKIKLADYTQAHTGAYLVIALDNKVLSAPKVNTAITGGKAVIQANFDKAAAESLAAQINSGALPVPLVVAR